MNMVNIYYSGTFQQNLNQSLYWATYGPSATFIIVNCPCTL